MGVSLQIQGRTQFISFLTSELCLSKCHIKEWQWNPPKTSKPRVKFSYTYSQYVPWNLVRDGCCSWAGYALLGSCLYREVGGKGVRSFHILYLGKVWPGRCSHSALGSGWGGWQSQYLGCHPCTLNVTSNQTTPTIMECYFIVDSITAVPNFAPLQAAPPQAFTALLSEPMGYAFMHMSFGSSFPFPWNFFKGVTTLIGKQGHIYSISQLFYFRYLRKINVGSVSKWSGLGCFFLDSR